MPRENPHDRPWTIGVVGHGISTPSRHATRPDLCASHGHPGVTYHPWLAADLTHSTAGSTWCLCGQVVVDGDHIVWPKPDDCGGPLVTCHHEPKET